jgi:hypothetical protein
MTSIAIYGNLKSLMRGISVAYENSSPSHSFGPQLISKGATLSILAFPDDYLTSIAFEVWIASLFP